VVDDGSPWSAPTESTVERPEQELDADSDADADTDTDTDAMIGHKHLIFNESCGATKTVHVVPAMGSVEQTHFWGVLPQNHYTLRVRFDHASSKHNSRQASVLFELM
jgi:hypothetical protein